MGEGEREEKGGSKGGKRRRTRIPLSTFVPFISFLALFYLRKKLKIRIRRE